MRSQSLAFHPAAGLVQARWGRGNRIKPDTIAAFEEQTVKEEIWVWSQTHEDFKVELLLWWWASLSWTLGSSPMTFQKGDWDDFPIWCLVWRIWPRRGGLAWDQGQDCWAVGTVSQQAEGLAEGLLSRICWVWDQVPSPVLCICQAVHTRGVGRSQWRNQSA